MRRYLIALFALAGLCFALDLGGQPSLVALRWAAAAQTPAGRPAPGAPRKRLLAWADTRNGQSQHESIGHALATIERLGYESGTWDTQIRTDSNIIRRTPKKTDGTPASGGPSLANVDAIFFMGHRDVPLDAAQKAELLRLSATATASWPRTSPSRRSSRGRSSWISSVPVSIGTRSSARHDRQREPCLPGDAAFSGPVPLQRRVLPAQGAFAREDRRAAAARSDERAGQPELALERRLSARVGEDLRQGTRLLLVARALVGQSGTFATCSRCTTRRSDGRSGLPMQSRGRIRFRGRGIDDFVIEDCAIN